MWRIFFLGFGKKERLSSKSEHLNEQRHQHAQFVVGAVNSQLRHGLFFGF